MNRGKSIYNNSFMGLLSQIITLFFTFLTRTIFIKYIGSEILGINGTFTSILNTLALSELGFQSAVAFNLYKPIYEKDTILINSVMNVFKLIYRCIGIFFILTSLLIMPFLSFFIKGIEITNDIYIFFLLQAVASASTYFFAYKRTLLYADQHDYISKAIDMLVNTLINIVQCIIIIKLKSYYLYLVLKIGQSIISNIIVHIYSSHKHPYLHSEHLNKKIFKVILNDAKNVFAGRIASYIYTSTDNLIISAFVGTSMVTWFVNYTTITNSIKNLTNSILSPLIPIIGSYLVDEYDNKKKEETFLIYTHIRYILAMILVVPFFLLIDDFIVMWVGNEYVMPRAVPILLGVDFYIHLVHSATADFINGAGLFRMERNIEILGATTNILSSLILVGFWGIPGVLIGTVISQMIFWIGRSWVVYRFCLKQNIGRYLKYWWRNMIYAFILVGTVFICTRASDYLSISNKLVRFLMVGSLCELIVVIILIILMTELREQKIIFKMAIKLLKKH
ncbi:lipopolysaccharide biosynthesis protein [Lacrimispora amygdalina]|uniref:lipopolysaccharide biosynthesis protein n=1 Tax=Lacrimispora amygdalina TaxID=253257 RepID=UPI000BE40C96|nr:oligosaccharide flippase family protein [Lacrimispora amygdalina]